MIEISIVIVNYNVRHFVLQCLQSIYNSDINVDNLEVFVVDNASVDGSVAAIASKYPKVTIIENAENIGFGRANNQAIQKAKGRFSLLLNPDTIIEEKTLSSCLHWMDQHPNHAALGVKMVDGQGIYLPESKRRLPSPLSSLFKLIGANRIFPNTPFFNGYYTSDETGDLDEEVEVLCGAYMFCQTKILQELEGFDEAFFMYGEDIDLCKRILESGHQIHYLGSQRIIHFKGESSKKASFLYLNSFYTAMMIYVDKHYQGGQAFLTKFVLKAAILLAGVYRAIKEWTKVGIRAILDFILIFIIIHLIKEFWSHIYFKDDEYYTESRFVINQFLYSAIWTGSLWFWGWYDHNRKWKSLLYGIVIGTLCILVAYALLPTGLRPSRSIILLSALTITGIVPLFDWLYYKIVGTRDATHQAKKVIVVGHVDDVMILKAKYKGFPNYEIIGAIAPNTNTPNPDYINNISALTQVIHAYKIDEVILCAQRLSAEKLMDLMTQPDQKVKYKIADLVQDQVFDSSHSSKQASIIDAFSSYHLANQVYRRLKRVTDIFIIVLLLLTFPISLWSKTARTILSQSLLVVIGDRTTIGYNAEVGGQNLPKINKPIFQITDKNLPKEYNAFIDDDINHWYAKNYTPFYDLEIIKNLW